ncbi:hypothetical protein [Streptomyces sp. NPDC000961]|uniref:hypothetical protein n=1 Tax=Streptomyces sp. NPDC000961 TaxID=3364541 RepID=UPI00367DBD29
MTQPTSASDRGIRISKVRLVHQSGEFDEYSFAPGMLNILYGVRNSSKSTTLRVIDYCLGDRDNPVGALGAAIADEYVEVATELRIDGRPYTLSRALTHGRMSKVNVNGEEIPASSFSDWVLGELGWPNLHIPLGLNPATASQLTPLSFRSTLRHVHRNEDSWISFANKEQEFTRRAVVSQLLGFVRSRTADAKREFDLAQAKRRLDEAQAVDREVRESTVQAVAAISESLQLPLARTSAQVAAARQEVRAELDAVRRQRQQLTIEIQGISDGGVAGSESPAGYDSTLTAYYSEVTGRVKHATDEVAALAQLLEEHRRSSRTVAAEIGRMERLIGSIGVFDALPVRQCPACEQEVDPHRHHAETSCYLCDQTVDDDKRQRRAQVEIRSLKSELEDLDEVVSRTAADLDSAHTRQRELQSQHAELAQRLNEERAAQLAPFVATLEQYSAQIARLEHKLTAFPTIESILQRRDDASQVLVSAQRVVDDLTNRPPSAHTAGQSAVDRCSAFADRMNSFLAEFQGDVWMRSDVSIRDSDLTFYVGTRPWDQALGAEAKVLFFLAYSYATLFLERDLDRECAFPGLLLLDNPYQQGIDQNVVRRVLLKLADAAQETGSQVISTQAVEPPMNPRTIRQIPMPTVYAAP